ncbi:MAG: septal ring lytic transglycosylase RlpA family protein [Gallionellaceae bacterium]|nr:MAG: septal ring lytic transglycosylase RlpA family protein [Gallionellaceae bacterium]
MNKQIALLLLATATLAACATSQKQQNARPAPIVDLVAGPGTNAPQPEAKAPAPEPSGGGYLTGDGPGADAPANLDDIPDAVPKVEPLHRYANRPYTALGKNFTPLEAPGDYKEVGIASWYGKKFHGQRTSIGEVYDMYGMTAAHPILPIPSYARVTNTATKKSVVVRVNDRGPFLHERIIDLSYTAAHKLGLINNGSAEVQVESIAVDGTAPLAVSTVLSTPLKPASALVAEPAPPVVVVAEVPAPVPGAATAPAGKVYLQLGAFKSPQGAESFLAKMRSKLGAVEKMLSLFQKDGLERVHLGPYATQDEARAAGEKLKARLGFKPYVSVR